MTGFRELDRLLIEQFYDDSVGRYGTDSEQARMLWQVLNPVKVAARTQTSRVPLPPRRTASRPPSNSPGPPRYSLPTKSSTAASHPGRRKRGSILPDCP